VETFRAAFKLTEYGEEHGWRKERNEIVISGFVY
jgi:hypothetical protein